MPIYEYVCPKCGTEAEALACMQDLHVEACGCGETMTRKVSLPMPAIFVLNNRQKLTNTVNGDNRAFDLPGNRHAQQRYKQVIGESLFP